MPGAEGRVSAVSVCPAGSGIKDQDGTCAKGGCCGECSVVTAREMKSLLVFAFLAWSSYFRVAQGDRVEKHHGPLPPNEEMPPRAGKQSHNVKPIVVFGMDGKVLSSFPGTFPVCFWHPTGAMSTIHI